MLQRALHAPSDPEARSSGKDLPLSACPQNVSGSSETAATRSLSLPRASLDVLGTHVLLAVDCALIPASRFGGYLDLPSPQRLRPVKMWRELLVMGAENCTFGFCGCR